MLVDHQARNAQQLKFDCCVWAGSSRSQLSQNSSAGLTFDLRLATIYF